MQLQRNTHTKILWSNNVKYREECGIGAEICKHVAYFNVKLFSYTNNLMAAVNFACKGAMYGSRPWESHIKYIALRYHMRKL